MKSLPCNESAVRGRRLPRTCGGRAAAEHSRPHSLPHSWPTALPASALLGWGRSVTTDQSKPPKPTHGPTPRQAAEAREPAPALDRQPVSLLPPVDDQQLCTPTPTPRALPATVSFPAARTGRARRPPWGHSFTELRDWGLLASCTPLCPLEPSTGKG